LLATNNKGNTPLVNAIEHNHKELVKLLLEAAENKGVLKKLLYTKNNQNLLPVNIALNQEITNMLKTKMKNLEST